MSQRDREDRMERVVDASQRVETHKGGGFERTAIRVPDGLKLFTPKKEGTYAFEIIPFDAKDGNPNCKPGDYYFERSYFVHRIPDPTRDGASAYCCNRATFRRSTCAVCDFIAKERSRPNFNDALCKQLKLSERQLWLLYDWDETSKGLQLWDISFFLFGKYLDNKIKLARPSDRDVFAKFASPKFNVGSTVKATGALKSMGKGQPFLEFAGIELAARRDPVPRELYDHQFCLDDLPIEWKYDEVMDVLMGSSGAAARAETRTTSDTGGRSYDDRGKGEATADPRYNDRAQGDDRRRDPEPERQREPERARDPEPRRDEYTDRGQQDTRRDTPPAREPEPRREDPPARKADSVADDYGIVMGSMVDHPVGGVCEVVHISGDGTALRLKTKNGDLLRAVDPSEVKVIKGSAAPAPAPARQEDPPRREEPRREEPRRSDPPREEPSRRRMDDDEPPPRRRDA